MASEENTLLNSEQEERIIESIKQAEFQTSGEIRVHIENHCKKDVLKRAKKLFHKLGMDQTDQNNGILLYIASEDHKVAIYGGKGLHEKVGQEFWDGILRTLITDFKASRFEQGIINCVNQIGEKLKKFYPYQDDDINELSDEISYNENSDT